MRAAAFLALAACGRVGFDASGDGGIGDATPRPYVEVVLADHPRFLFRLDDKDGELARDATGNGNDTPYDVFGGLLVHGRPGALGDGNTATLFEGDGNAGPNIGASVELMDIGTTWAGDFTIELWFQPTKIVPGGINGALFVCERYLQNGLRTGLRHEMDLELWTTEAGHNTALQGTSTLALGAWAHVVFVRRGAVAEIWRDGTLEATGGLDYAPVDPNDAATECGFGAFHGLAAYGVFDEVAVYETALSAGQIAAHHAAR